MLSFCTDYCYTLQELMAPDIYDTWPGCFDPKLCAAIRTQWDTPKLVDEHLDEFKTMRSLEIPHYAEKFRKYPRYNGRLENDLTLQLENDLLASTYKENLNSTFHRNFYGLFEERAAYRKCLLWAEHTQKEYIGCLNEASNYFFVPKEWFNGVGVRKYFKEEFAGANGHDIGVIPFLSREREVLSKLQSAEKMSGEELYAFWNEVKDVDYYIRCGADDNRKILSVSSVVKNLIYLNMCMPLCSGEYYELIRTNVKLYCPKCPKEVSLTCDCCFCTWVRLADEDAFSMKKEIDGHHFKCRTVEELKKPFLQKMFNLSKKKR